MLNSSSSLNFSRWSIEMNGALILYAINQVDQQYIMTGDFTKKSWSIIMRQLKEQFPDKKSKFSKNKLVSHFRDVLLKDHKVWRDIKHNAIGITWSEKQDCFLFDNDQIETLDGFFSGLGPNREVFQRNRKKLSIMKFMFMTNCCYYLSWIDKYLYREDPTNDLTRINYRELNLQFPKLCKVRYKSKIYSKSLQFQNVPNAPEESEYNDQQIQKIFITSPNSSDNTNSKFPYFEYQHQVPLQNIPPHQLQHLQHLQQHQQHQHQPQQQQQQHVQQLPYYYLNTHITQSKQFPVCGPIYNHFKNSTRVFDGFETVPNQNQPISTFHPASRSSAVNSLASQSFNFSPSLSHFFTPDQGKNNSNFHSNNHNNWNWNSPNETGIISFDSSSRNLPNQHQHSLSSTSSSASLLSSSLSSDSPLLTLTAYQQINQTGHSRNNGKSQPAPPWFSPS